MLSRTEMSCISDLMFDLSTLKALVGNNIFINRNKA